MTDLSTKAQNVDIRTMVPVDAIIVLPGRRKLDPAWVETLAELMATPADCSPIEVTGIDGGGYQLIYGGHRLAAFKRRGWAAIPAIIRDRASFASEAAITLREITENLARRELSVLDRAVDIARWREVYEATNLLNRLGGRPRKPRPEDIDETSAKFALVFSTVAQQTLDISRRSIFHALKIASIPSDIRDRIALHPIADNQSELLLLAVEPYGRQSDIAALLTSEPAQAATIADAIAIIDRMPKPVREERWLKVSTAFSNLRPLEQRRFFRLHEAAIRLWLQETGS